MPTVQAIEAAERVHDPARQRAANNSGQRNAEEEDRADLGMQPRRIPVGQIENDAGIEAGLRDPEQEAHAVELPWGVDEQHRGRDDAPDHH